MKKQTYKQNLKYNFIQNIVLVKTKTAPNKYRTAFSAPTNNELKRFQCY